jgi:hypothetical protein
MPIESATYIDQLNAAWPLPTDPISEGDNHLQLIKGVLQSQFTSLGAAAVVRTAAELNAVTAKLTSFNGRTVPAVVPTDGDYTLNLLGDVAITAPVSGQILQNNGVGWVNQLPAITSGHFLYDGYAGRVTDSMWFTNARLTTTLGTIKNDGAGGIGWTYTAIRAQIVCLTVMAYWTGGNVNETNNLAIGRTAGAPPAALPAAGANRAAFGAGSRGPTTPGDNSTITVTANVRLTANDVLAIYWQPGGTVTPANVTVSGACFNVA